MRYRHLFERTTWHDQPRLDAVQQVKNLCAGDYENKFISFTKLEKLGVNPNNIHSTPIGLYTYPVKYALESAKHTDFSALPYAGNNPFIHFIEISPSANIWVMSDRSNIGIYCDKLIKYAADNSINLVINKTLTSQNLYQCVVSLAEKISNKSATTKMAIIFRNVLGLDALYDDGNGIMHSNEPTQMVVLNPKIIVRHKLLSNDIKQHNPAVKINFGLEEPIIAVTEKEALRQTANKQNYKTYKDDSAIITTKITEDGKIFIVYTDEQHKMKLNFVTTKAHVHDGSISYGVVFGLYKGDRIENTQVSNAVTKQKLFAACEKFLLDKARKNEIDMVSNWFGIELKRIGNHKLEKTLKTVGKFNVKIDPDIDDCKVYIKGPNGIISFCAVISDGGIKVYDFELGGTPVQLNAMVVPNAVESLQVVYDKVTN